MVEALREAGAEVLGVVSIFTIRNGKRTGKYWRRPDVKNISLTDFDTIVAGGRLRRATSGIRSDCTSRLLDDSQTKRHAAGCKASDNGRVVTTMKHLIDIMQLGNRRNR